MSGLGLKHDAQMKLSLQPELMRQPGWIIARFTIMNTNHHTKPKITHCCVPAYCFCYFFCDSLTSISLFVSFLSWYRQSVNRKSQWEIDCTIKEEHRINRAERCWGKRAYTTCSKFIVGAEVVRCNTSIFFSSRFSSSSDDSHSDSSIKEKQKELYYFTQSNKMMKTGVRR